MTEATQPAAPEGTPPAAAPWEVPEEIPQEEFDHLLQANRVERGEPVAEAVSPSPPQGESPPPVENDDGSLPVNERFSRIEEGITTLANIVSNITNTPTPTTENTPTAEEQLIENNPDQEADGLKWLSKNVQTVVAPMIDELKGQVSALQGSVQTSQQEGASQQINTVIESLMDKHQISGAYDRAAMRSAVLNEGINRLGNTFRLHHIEPLFNKLNTMRLEGVQKEEDAMVENHRQDLDAIPPVTTPQVTPEGGNLAARIRDPKDRKMDFRGDDFARSVQQYVDRQSGNLLGE